MTNLEIIKDGAVETLTGKHARKEYLRMVEKKRGKVAADRLMKRVMEIWNK